MTLTEIWKVQSRIIRHDRCVIRFWVNHPKSHKNKRFRAEEKFAEHQLVWLLRERKEVKERITQKVRKAQEQALLPQWLVDAFTCIHGYEGAWNANTGNGYYGGMQMDLAFQGIYGAEFIQQYGTADKWPIKAQLIASARAYHSGRGFYPWPNTARACKLIT